MTKAKSCPPGKYWCFTDKKCKKIPMGYHVMGGGRLMKDEDHENGEDGKKKGKKNGNGNGGNGNSNGNGDGGGVSENTILEKRDGKSAKDKGYSLRDWFKGGGWKQTGGKYDGKPCARQPGQKTKPFCRDADDRAAMSKDERNRRAAKKRREDPNPDRKGKAKMVTDSYDFSNWRDEFKALEFETVDIIGTEPLKPTEGLGSKMLGEKFKTQYGDKTKLSQSSERKSLGRGSSIKDGSKKSGYESKKEFRDQSMKLRKHRERSGDLAKEENDLNEKCWKGYEKKGMKTMFGKRYPNCVKKEELELQQEMASEKDINKKLQKKVNSKDLNPAEYIKNTRLMPGSGIPKKLPEEKKDPCWDTHKQVGMKKKNGRMVPNCVPKEETYSDWRTEIFEGDGDHEYEMARRQLATIKNAVSRLEKKMGETGEGELKAWVQAKLTRSADDIDTVADYVTNEETIQEGEKDACYHKVKSRYSVWPSAYASGALVKCRKVGAKNWGNKSKTKKEEVQYLNTEDYQRIQEYGNVYTIIVLWRGKSHRLQLFFQGTARPSRDEVKNEVEKIYPGGMVSYYFPSATDPGKPIIVSTRS